MCVRLQINWVSVVENICHFIDETVHFTFMIFECDSSTKWICQRVNYLTSGWISLVLDDCFNCLGEYFCETPGSTSPTGPCLAGFFCTSRANESSPTDSVTGNICPQGKYCPEGSSEGTVSSAIHQCVVSSAVRIDQSHFKICWNFHLSNWCCSFLIWLLCLKPIRRFCLSVLSSNSFLLKSIWNSKWVFWFSNDYFDTDCRESSDGEAAVTVAMKRFSSLVENEFLIDMPENAPAFIEKFKSQLLLLYQLFWQFSSFIPQANFS